MNNALIDRTKAVLVVIDLQKGVVGRPTAPYHGNRRVRKLPAYEQLLVRAFAQLTWRESLRDIETCLASFGPKLYHAGIRQPTARSPLADANEHRDWRSFAGGR
jgi:hypothetical protein